VSSRRNDSVSSQMGPSVKSGGTQCKVGKGLSVKSGRGTQCKVRWNSVLSRDGLSVKSGSEGRLVRWPWVVG